MDTAESASEGLRLEMAALLKAGRALGKSDEEIAADLARVALEHRVRNVTLPARIYTDTSAWDDWQPKRKGNSPDAGQAPPPAS